VIITGDGFSNAFKVEFGNGEALKFNVDSDTQITAMAPPGTGIVDVVVWGVDGASGVNRFSKFTYKALAGGDYPPPALEPGTAYA